MLSPPDSRRGKLLSQYVCARLVALDGIDIALFDFDGHNALYYFLMNADGQIYMRYGGRDADSASTYLNLRSLELALKQGLEIHQNREQYDFPANPKPVFPRDMPDLKARTIKKNLCVECHLVDDFRVQAKEANGNLNRLQDLYRSPDIKRIGIFLDVPKGLVVGEAKDAVQKAGMKAGDLITHVENKRVWTFADLQFNYDKVPRDRKKVNLTVDRNGQSVELVVELPERWWFNYLDFRHWSVEPKTYFKTTPLTAKEKKELGLNPDGFASRVSHLEFYQAFAEPRWKLGDIITGVEGADTDKIANTPDLHIKLRYDAGDVLELQMLRDGKPFSSILETEQERFRK